MKIAVGSQNPAKLEAVRLAFKAVWPDEELDVLDCKVRSGVPSQPVGDSQCIRGARGRARRALMKHWPDFAVGLEGGACQAGDEFFDRGWVVVIDKNGKEGIGSTCSIVIPEKILKIIYKGQELGMAADEVFGTVNCKEKDGYYGLMTKNAITRACGYRDGVISALARFIRPEMF